MDTLTSLIDLFLHLDKHLVELAVTYGLWLYAILFLIIFCETGLVITPFLPGDSLLFAVGALSAGGALEVHKTVVLLIIAAILGDSVNYYIGKRAGTWLLGAWGGRLIKKEHVVKTEKFFERYGGKTIIFARFVPIIRTLAPFMAGVGSMDYSKFLIFNISGGIAWVALFIYGGYLFGGLPIIKNNFSLVILAIIIISLLPPLIEAVRERKRSRVSDADVSVAPECRSKKIS
jgi:membrane-associated protein